MGEAFNFPDVGEGITEGKLVKWLVKEGENVKGDQSVAEVETDKAVVEVPCPHEGTIGKLLHNEGDTIEVGKPLLEFGEGGASSEPEPVKEEKESPAPKEEPKQEEPKKEEQPAHTPQPGGEQQTSTASESAQAPAQQASHSSETLALPSVRHEAKEKNIDLTTVKGTGPEGRITMQDLGGDAAVSQPAPQQKPKSPAEQQAQTPKPAAQTPAPVAAAGKDILATPSTRKLARELGVDINTIKGTGDNGKITNEDVKNASQGKAPEAPTAAKPEQEEPETKPASPATPQSSSGAEERVPLSSLRKAIAKKMVESKHTAPHVTYCDEADVTELVNVRTKEKEAMKEKGVKLTFLPFFMKAAVIALKKHPNVNAQLDDEKQELILKKEYHLGFAADTKEGLFAPTIKDVDKKSIVELSRELMDLSAKARDMKLSPAEMSGATFTITSIGSIGGTVFTPIINYPQVAIMGVGKIEDKPIVIAGEIIVRKICTFSLSFDHRVIDGAEAARFMNDFMELIKDPMQLFMEME